jgi:hypothetical protein
MMRRRDIGTTFRSRDAANGRAAARCRNDASDTTTWRAVGRAWGAAPRHPPGARSPILAGPAVAMTERGTLVFEKVSFARLVAALLAISFVIGFAVVVMGATTNTGTTSAIAIENATIMSAERASCARFGTYASISTLRRDGLLTFKPVYNSVVIVPGKHCGTIVVGSPAYQSPAG